MTGNEWFSGPPPSCGWWPASVAEKAKAVRWWNGEYWSIPVSVRMHKIKAADKATRKSIFTDVVRWQHRPKSWPARSFT